MKNTSLLLRARRELRLVADPRRAPGMKAYMKSTMPYHGVSAPLMRAANARIFQDSDFRTRAVWHKGILELWRGAKYREERYVAIAMCGDKRSAAYQTLSALPIYEEVIVTGAWWDYVDTLAAWEVGALLRKYPAAMQKRMLRWSISPNMWKRRTSIICQLRFKKDTNLPLLYACIGPSLDSKEFFLRKAIGWALRQYAWTDPEEVRRYVKENRARLSGLSQREALKNI